MNTLITARFDDRQFARLEPRLGTVKRAGFGQTQRKLSEAAVIREVDGIELFIFEFEPVTREVLVSASSSALKLIICCRNEPQANVDLAAATELGIPVAHTPGRNAVSVAEYTMGMMIAIARHIHLAHHLLRYTEELTQINYDDERERNRLITSEWSMDPRAPFARFKGPELAGKTLGLVGCGAIGGEIAKRARAFGMRVVCADPLINETRLLELGVIRLDLTTVARESDFLAVAAKVTASTRGLVSAEVIRLMKSTAYLINTARAAIVDYGALCNALQNGRLAGAALDVYEEEPLPSAHPLRKLDNVLLSPHLAGASWDIPKTHSRMAADDVIRYLQGDQPRHLANPEVWGKRRR